MKVSRKQFGVSKIDLSPMLDVMFQLVLFFLVSTTFSQIPALHISLPEVSSEQSVRLEQNSAVIALEKNGALYLNKTPIQKESLGAAVTALCPRTERAHFLVYVYADKDVPYGAVAGIFDTLQKNGFFSVTIMVENEADF